MSSAAPKRSRSKKRKPQPLKLSFGSSSGVSSCLPSNVEANFPELVEQLQMKKQEAEVEGDYGCYLEDANGNVTGWSAHKYSAQDFGTDSPGVLDGKPEPAWCQGDVGCHSSDASGDAKSPSSSDWQDFKLDHPEAVENGSDTAGMQEEQGDPPLAVAKDAEGLTVADVADIVRRCRAFLGERGPSQEEELCCEEVLGPHRVGLVRASIGSLAALLTQQPGFRHTLEGDLSFLYLDPEEDENHHSAEEAEPPPSPDANFPQDGPRSGNVSPCGSSGHSSYLSASDDLLEGLEARRRRRKDACSQTTPTVEEKAPGHCSCQGQGGQKDTYDRHTQTTCLDTVQLVEQELRLKEKIRDLEAKIASLEDDHDREIRELRLAFDRLKKECRCQQAPPSPLTPTPPSDTVVQAVNGCATTEAEEAQGEETEASQFTPPVVPDDVLSNGVCAKEDEEVDRGQAGSPTSCSGEGGVGTVLPNDASSSSRGERAVHPEEEELPEEELPSEPPAAKPIQAEAENRSSRPNARAPSSGVPDYAELHWRLEQYRRGSSCADLDSGGAGASQYGSTCSTPRSKSDAQIAKIVMQIRRKMPNLSEADAREYLSQVRRLQGGFSGMTRGDIEALVLNYVRQNSPQER